MYIQISVLAVLILLSGFFSGSEIALFSLSPAKVRSMVLNKRKNAMLIERLKADPQKLLIAILVGNNIVNLSASSIATLVAIDVFGSIGAGIATGVMTFLILFFGEIVPKSVGQKYAESVAAFIAPFMRLLMAVLNPIIWLMNILTDGFQKMVRMKPHSLRVSEEEVKALVHLGHEEGAVEEDEKEMIENVFVLNDITASDIMTPNDAIVSVRSSMTVRSVLSLIEQTEYSRYPVYNARGTIEGILYLKDIFALFAKDESAAVRNEHVLDTPVSAIMERPIFVSESMYLDDLLKDFQSRHIHIAIVLDARGRAVGLVTLEDLLEEIVGEIQDETDSEMTPSMAEKQVSVH